MDILDIALALLIATPAIMAIGVTVAIIIDMFKN